ncbi:MAG TPA: hypothetical protein VKD00_02270 [Methyloceanibacter sp.]|nr:hypothetical protein [Methyloceanibacter sp.]
MAALSDACSLRVCVALSAADLRLALDHHEGIGDWAIIPRRKFLTKERGEIVDESDRTGAAVEEVEIGCGVGQRLRGIDATDARQKAATGVNQDLSALVGFGQFQAGARDRRGIGILRVIQCYILRTGLRAQRILACFNAPPVASLGIVAWPR